ncbi:hypothetical protein CNECB9_2370075 [Cupriavidus necator]|uniref:Uncharacterized protein n=1 Tax=Cupriavidus necator TaxID=106590 RepID=A0A1K0IDV2_CUPNE|nr:hypothetical protein CNECB9_2370075 [Cupriavidus necator]
MHIEDRKYNAKAIAKQRCSANPQWLERLIPGEQCGDTSEAGGVQYDKVLDSFQVPSCCYLTEALPPFAQGLSD